MPVLLIDGNLVKVACHSCIKGHRSRTCKHWDRVLIELRKPGRPQAACQHSGTEISCGCDGRSAFYVPGHQPRFAVSGAAGTAGKDDTPVVVNALEHREPITRSTGQRAESKTSISAVEDTLEMSGTSSSAKRPNNKNSVRRRVMDVPMQQTLPSQSVKSTSDPMIPPQFTQTIPAQPQTYHEQNYSSYYTGHALPDASASEGRSCCQDSSSSSTAVPRRETSIFESGYTSLMQQQSRPQPEFSNYMAERRPSRSEYLDSVQSMSTAGLAHYSGVSNRPVSNLFDAQHTQPPRYQSQLGQTPQQPYIPTPPASSVHGLITPSAPPFAPNTSWQAFPVFTPSTSGPRDTCSCPDEARCFCEGCLVHPRNPATMQMVMDALQYQHSDTYQQGYGNLGSETTEPIHSPSALRNAALYPPAAFPQNPLFSPYTETIPPSAAVMTPSTQTSRIRNDYFSQFSSYGSN